MMKKVTFTFSLSLFIVFQSRVALYAKDPTPTSIDSCSGTNPSLVNQGSVEAVFSAIEPLSSSPAIGGIDTGRVTGAGLDPNTPRLIEELLHQQSMTNDRIAIFETQLNDLLETHQGPSQDSEESEQIGRLTTQINAEVNRRDELERKLGELLSPNVQKLAQNKKVLQKNRFEPSRKLQDSVHRLLDQQDQVKANIRSLQKDLQKNGTLRGVRSQKLALLKIELTQLERQLAGQLDQLPHLPGKPSLGRRTSNSSLQIAPKAPSVGLNNPGNTCFANSVYQLIHSSPSLRAAIELKRTDEKAPKDANEARQHRRAEELRASLRQLLAAMDPQAKKTTDELKPYLARVRTAFNSASSVLQIDGNPKDAHEFLSTVLDILDLPSKLVSGKKVLVDQMEREGHHLHPLSNITVNLGFDQTPATAQQVLNQHFAPERLRLEEGVRENGVRKPTINQHFLKAIRGKTPDEVPIVFVRNSFKYQFGSRNQDGSAEKNRKPVDLFGAGANNEILLNFLSEDPNGKLTHEMKVAYEPVSFVVHRTDRNHYFTYTRDPKTNDWWLYDDSVVRKLNSSEIEDAKELIRTDCTIVNLAKKNR